jgi:hypothetical protein
MVATVRRDGSRFTVQRLYRGYRGYGFVTIQLAFTEVAAVNEHRCTSEKRSGIARLAPLHVGKAADECCEKQVRRYVVGP